MRLRRSALMFLAVVAFVLPSPVARADSLVYSAVTTAQSPYGPGYLNWRSPVVHAAAQLVITPDPGNPGVQFEQLQCEADNLNPFGAYNELGVPGVQYLPTWSADAQCYFNVVMQDGTVSRGGMVPFDYYCCIWSPATFKDDTFNAPVPTGSTVELCVQAGGFYSYGTRAQHWSNPPSCTNSVQTDTWSIDEMADTGLL